MTRRTRNPVSSFGPELMAVLIKGARERVEIPCKDAKELAYLQLRLQTLRGSMGREKHPQYELSTRARTSRMWDVDEFGKPHNFRLIVEPQDIRFRDAILAAGITTTAIDSAEDVLADLPEPSTPIDPSTEPALVDPSAPDPYASFKKG